MKKLFMLLIGFLMLFTVAACGKEEVKDNDDSKKDSTKKDDESKKDDSNNGDIGSNKLTCTMEMNEEGVSIDYKYVFSYKGNDISGVTVDMKTKLDEVAKDSWDMVLGIYEGMKTTGPEGVTIDVTSNKAALTINMKMTIDPAKLTAEGAKEVELDALTGAKSIAELKTAMEGQGLTCK